MPATRSTARIACVVAAVVALAAMGALGFAVTHYGEPAVLVTLEHAWLNHGTLVAWWLAWCCYMPVLLPLAIVLLILAWRLPAWRYPILFSIVMLLLCWLCTDLLQRVFARPRRLDWVVKHETAFSYPSSHAAISTGFYALWGVLLAASALPRAVRMTAALCLFALTAGILWSRLALGAHYVTDLAGGILLATGLVFAGLAAVGDKVLGAPAGRP